MILLITAFAATEGHTQIYGKFEAATAGLIAKQLRVTQNSASESDTPYLAVRSYPVGSPSHLVKFDFENNLSYNGIGHSIGFIKNDARSIQLVFNQPQEIKSSPELYCGFCIYVPADCEGGFELLVWNYSRKVNRSRTFKATPGKWHFEKIKLNGPGFLEDGEILKGFSIMNKGTGLRNWYMDNLVIWNGTVPAPQPVREAAVASRNDEGNLISWQPAAGSLPIIKYRIHRGSVPDFPLAPDNLIGETHLLNFSDASLMHSEYYYMIVAEDAAGNRSVPGKAVKQE